MNQDLTKDQRRRLRKLGTVAYERELSEELAKLESEFRRWRSNEIDAFELAETIHRFHQEPARDLFSTYTRSAIPVLAVAHAIHRGLISPEEAGPEVMEVLAPRLAFLRSEEDS